MRVRVLLRVRVGGGVRVGRRVWVRASVRVRAGFRVRVRIRVSARVRVLVNHQNPLLNAILRQVFCKLRTTALPHDFSFVFLELVS